MRRKLYPSWTVDRAICKYDDLLQQLKYKLKYYQGYCPDLSFGQLFTIAHASQGGSHGYTVGFYSEVGLLSELLAWDARRGLLDPELKAADIYKSYGVDVDGWGKFKNSLHGEDGDPFDRGW